MDVQTDIRVQGDTSQNTPSLTSDHVHVPGDIALNADSNQDNASTPSLRVHSSLVTNSCIEHCGGQGPVHAFKESSDAGMEINKIDQGQDCTNLQSNSDQAILPGIVKEISAVDSAEGCTSLTNIDEAGAHLDPIRSSLMPVETVIQTPHTKLDGTASLDHPTDEEKIGDESDYPEDFLLSLPPSSSPPQLFSSSPYASSQSSVGDVEHSATELVVEVGGCASSHEYAHGDHAARNDLCVESEDLHSHDTAEIATSPIADKCLSQIDSTLDVEGSLELSRKRTADSDESFGSPSIKRSKDSRPYLPPAPKRATIALHHHQFKKLASPFRSPLKFPVVADGPQITDNRKVELTTSATPETSHNRTHGTAMPLRHKVSNSSRSITQFKSPLVNGVVPADSRTIRLTPALQTLERQLQLLKRAVKVKENNEEELLNRLAVKWIEAGREAAYNVWDAVKDTSDFAGRATLIRRQHGWESTNDEITPWGLDTKRGDASKEPCEFDPPEASRTKGRLAPEEDDDVSCNTLGTMLRQLGIAPEIFGWDDDKETFSD